MALMAYMKVRGQKQGWIKGSVTQKGREDSIAVIAYHHSVVSPRDPQSGLPTGQRMHKPFTVVKNTDKATPPLYTALCTNESLPEVIINFWQPQVKAATGIGSAVQHYTVKLTNAGIEQVHLFGGTFGIGWVTAHTSSALGVIAAGGPLEMASYNLQNGIYSFVTDGAEWRVFAVYATSYHF